MLFPLWITYIGKGGGTLDLYTLSILQVLVSETPFINPLEGCPKCGDCMSISCDTKGIDSSLSSDMIFPPNLIH